MKSLKLVLALVILGGFAATCGAELVGTGIVKKVWLEEVRQPRGQITDGDDPSKWVYEPSPDEVFFVKTLWVEIEKPEEGDPPTWNTIDGGFASDATFWNPSIPFFDDPKDGLEADKKDLAGTEFLVPTYQKMHRLKVNDHVDIMTGSQVLRDGEPLGGGQLSLSAAAWAVNTKIVDGNEVPVMWPPVTASGKFPLAQFMVPVDAEIYTIQKGTLGPIEFLGGATGAVQGTIEGSFVPEPSSIVLGILGAVFAVILVFRRRIHS